ncbi:MAG: glutamate formimidoyltransferase [Acidobacteriaceae bacterium]|nr:glutamate formimidoyltransferase [Acidobacteriaceae bacterium]
MNSPLIECVPNFSEGRELARVNALELAISSVAGVVVLHRTSDPDHNRSVITFAGKPEPVLEAAVRATAKAVELIDVSRHQGVHPRVGALDVLPFVPLGPATLAECVELAHKAGQRIWNELRIPIYFYGAAATRPDRMKLEDVRRGEFEGLAQAVTVDQTKTPDFGGPNLHPRAGAVIVGARKILIAYNINLKTKDVRIAKSIAKQIRESSGGLKAVKALGLPLTSRGLVQISMNLTDYEQTPIPVVYAEVSRLATLHGVEIEESELIGLVPRKALEMTTAASLKLSDFDSQRVIENRIETLSRAIHKR